ncbi:MAG: hypothetical protein EU544_05745 [Promethearchaeota archaeon]|nr:MAG: hypothetical protein EU544_05745 [Candidatus Lokiarchaeota archaeon]
MTHSLHRKEATHEISDDYVILTMLAQGYNDHSKDAKKRHIRIGQILKDHNPVNMLREAGWSISSVIQACYDNAQDVSDVLNALKEEDLGISVVVSGLISEIRRITRENGLKLHTVNLSLGEFGNKKKLPPNKILEITTMCGHHCISAESVLHNVELIKEGKISLRKAAEKIASPCVCGIFNTSRAEKILRDLVEN